MLVWTVWGGWQETSASILRQTDICIVKQTYVTDRVF